MKEKIFHQHKNQLIREVEDRDIGLKGFLVIDSQVNGMSCGGLRIMPTITLQEIKDLAKAMSLKQGFIGLPRGGARAGIIADDSISVDRKQQLINRFGELIQEELIGRRYLLEPDVGTDPEEINQMYQHLNIDVPKPSKTSANSGYYTSLSVRHCMAFGLQKRLGKELKDATVAIEGFGRVGKPLAIQLYDSGAKIVAVSNIFGGIYDSSGLAIPALVAFLEKEGEGSIQSFPTAMAIPKESLLELEVDVLSPSATDSTIHSQNALQVKAPVICAGANNPVTARADEILFEKGKLYFPDFVSNCGGVLGNAVEFAGMKEKHTLQLIQKEVLPILSHICEVAQKKKISPYSCAIELIEHKMSLNKKTSPANSVKHQLTQMALNLYRKGWFFYWMWS